MSRILYAQFPPRTESSRPELCVYRNLRNGSNEDAPIMFSGDLIDATAPSYHPKDNKDHFFVPRSGPLNFEYDLHSTNDQLLHPDTALSSLLSAYSLAKLAGRYTFQKDDNGWINILPLSVNDQRGQASLARPLLGVPITISHADQSVDDLLKQVIITLQRERHTRVLLGTQLSRSFMAHKCKISGVHPASAVLETMLADAGEDAIILLQFDPNDEAYILSIINRSQVSAAMAH